MFNFRYKNMPKNVTKSDMSGLFCSNCFPEIFSSMAALSNLSPSEEFFGKICFLKSGSVWRDQVELVQKQLCTKSVPIVTDAGRRQAPDKPVKALLDTHTRHLIPHQEYHKVNIFSRLRYRNPIYLFNTLLQM